MSDEVTGADVCAQAITCENYLRMFAKDLAMLQLTKPLADKFNNGADEMGDLAANKDKCNEIATIANTGAAVLRLFMTYLQSQGHPEAALALGSHGAPIA